jgi:uncharacterized membrane protein YtjA (UPF0391 family)
MSNVAWYALCLLIGLALDWALSDRIITSAEVLLKRNAAVSYKEAFFPRVAMTVVSLIAVANGTAYQSPPAAIFYVGVAGFLISLMYGVTRQTSKRGGCE